MSMSEHASSGRHSTLSSAEEAIPLLDALFVYRWSRSTIAAGLEIPGKRTINEWKRGLDDIDEAIARATADIPERPAN